MLRELLILAVAGAAGTISRYALSGWTYKLLGERFAWGTLTVNVIGCFALGALMQVGLTTDALPRELRLGLGVGFLGAFTTYSTFSYETVRYLEEGAWWNAGGNIAANLVIGIIATLAGLAAARAAFGGA